MRTGRASSSRGREPRKNQDKIKAPERPWDALDEALDETFPASDPVAITIARPIRQPDRGARKRR